MSSKMNQLENKEYIQTLISLKERILQAQYNSYSAVNSEMILPIWILVKQ